MKVLKVCLMVWAVSGLLLTACETGVSEMKLKARETPPETLVGSWLSVHQQKVVPDLIKERIALRHQMSQANELAYGYEGPFITEQFDRKWFEADREHFIHLHQMPESTPKTIKIYQEMLQLRKHQQRVIRRVADKHPHYRIYDPSETDEINSLFIAIRARQQWLQDAIYSGIKDDWAAYYPDTYEYAFFQMNRLNIQGGIETATINVTDGFSAYDEALVTAFLDSLPVPGKVYRGKEIFFVNGYNEEYGAVHANGQIMVFNLFDEMDDTLKLIAHEIGHEAGHLIFGRDYYENENKEAKADYAALYDLQVPVDERTIWEMRLSENFAEDFAWVYGGYPKWTYWHGVEEAVIRSFIETHLETGNLEDAILIRDNLRILGDGQEMTFFGGIHDDHLIIGTEPEITISIDGFYLGPYRLFAHTRNDVTGNLPRRVFDESGKVTLDLLTLPEEHRRMEEEGYVSYEIQVKMYYYTSLTEFHQPTIARFRVLMWQGWQ